MFDKNHLEEVLLRYKQDFLDIEWDNEKYKWIAIKQFQDTWDINASDFAKMLVDIPVRGNRLSGGLETASPENRKPLPANSARSALCVATLMRNLV